MINSITRLFASVFGDHAGDGKIFHPSLKCPECGSRLMKTAVDEDAGLAESGGSEQSSQQDFAATGAAASRRPRGPGSLGEAAAAELGAGAAAGPGVRGLAPLEFQQQRLREWAQRRGVLIAEADWAEHRLIAAATAEHEVRFRAADHRAIKRTHPGTFGFIPRQQSGQWKAAPASPLEYLERWQLQNELFDDSVVLEGVMVSAGASMVIGQPPGGISLVISQAWLDAVNPDAPHPTDAAVAEYLIQREFVAIPGSFFGWRRDRDKTVILDAKSDNFILTRIGLLPIDLQVTRDWLGDAATTSAPQKQLREASLHAAWLCPNSDCPAQLRARIAQWCSPGAMDIAGGERLAAQLVQSGLVISVAELYRLKARELTRLEGLDAAAAQKFLEAIAASKKRELWRVLYGLRISGVSADAAQALARQFPTLHHVLGASARQLTAAEQVSEAMAQSIIYWTGDRLNRDLIKRLDKAGVNFKSETYRPAGKTE